MQITKTDLRPTVAGLLVKRDGDSVHIGMHQSVRAMLKGYVRYTTVGGGILHREEPRVAMARELEEEYGDTFARECSIEKLLGSPQDGEGWSGARKSYWWFLIVHHGFSVPTVQVEECADFRWCPLTTIQNGTALSHFSDNKFLMILHALECAIRDRPDIFE